ncbi:riboflavin biosynthesis protein RibF [Syntrophotalea acetylenivorans]|uniref:Riboflavin biosynthesis protein n=1 Tax=Syntrophotalea acetylenivorans TaxID=1842532 RepID=A0A1L3GSJ7_9BACT|nr:bifunctional riboflavin kinase/FAD synthetase [Syntrophotalea acetylenivorans]APG28913.1 riboflavin biosynthesis protein RibF [Syntrophotalea acetylenivorans]
MRIIKNLSELKEPLQDAVVTIGNFDGVHLGHREIFRRVVRRSQELGGPAVVYTFEPHPLKFLAPDRAPLLINTNQEKAVLIEASCIDVLIRTPFDQNMADLPAHRFVREILVEKVGMRHLVVGYDYLFGKGREGNAQLLQRMGEYLGFAVEVLEPISGEGQVYSSTRIRQLIKEGQVHQVVDLLGRNFTLQGRVVHGFKRGQKLGFPTANLQTDKELLPSPGVYAVKVKRGAEVFNGVLNIGLNPTFEAAGLSIEVHLLDFDGQLYGEDLRVYFVKRLRDEMRFADSSELVQAISADIVSARQILSETEIIQYHDYLDCGQ